MHTQGLPSHHMFPLSLGSDSHVTAQHIKLMRPPPPKKKKKGGGADSFLIAVPTISFKNTRAVVGLR